LALLGLALTGMGSASLRRGDLFYENWWGGLVFGPMAIVFGILLMIGAVFAPTLFEARLY
jgi:hypothetical protein